MTLSGISNLHQPGILQGAAFTGETLIVIQIHRAIYSKFGSLELWKQQTQKVALFTQHFPYTCFSIHDCLPLIHKRKKPERQK